MKRIVAAPFRRLFQVAAFVLTAPWLFIGWLRCPFGVPFVSCASCSVSNCPGTWLQPFVIGALVLTHLVRPRFFCGWLCPMGFLQDALGMPFGRRGRPFGSRPSTPRRALRWIKYAGLVAVVVLVFALNYPAERAHDYVVRSPRILDFQALDVAFSLGLTRYPVRAALLVAGIVGGIFIVRFWCRYLCPLGALLALGSRLTFGRLRLREEVCVRCGACGPVCPMATEPGAAECISCHECSDVCPAGAIRAGRGRPTAAAADDKKVRETDDDLPA